MAELATAPALRWYQGIERRLWVILAVTYAGWLLDSMDLNLFTIVLVPSLRELLGPQATPQSIGYYGGTIAALQLLGWGIGGLVFGIIGDYWGRARTLVLSIACYSVFTALSGFATSWWDLAIFRFLMAFGVGAEWAIGVSLISETWPRRSRVIALGIMMSAFGFGYLLAGLVNLLIGGWGWRWVFFAGIIPGVWIAIIRRAVPESERWQHVSVQREEARTRLKAGGAVTQQDRAVLSFSFVGLFEPPWLTNTVSATGMAFAVTMGFWGVQTWIPARAIELAVAGKANVPQVVTITIIILNLAAAVGTFSFACLTEWIGRRPAFVLGSLGNMICLPIVFLVPQDYQTLYLLVPLMGLFTNGVLGVFTPYFPELFPTRLRATGVGFCFNVSRILATAGPFIAGTLVGFFGGIPKAGAFMALCYAIGLVAVWFAPETRGKPLPD
jgi:MFS family permease